MERIKLDGHFIIDILRAALIALFISIVAVIAFAFVFKALELSGAVLKIGNELIKLISIFVGTFLGIKVMKQGVLKGVCIGLLFLLFSILIMKIFNSGINEPLFTAMNVALSLFFGIASGIFAVNFKRRI
ncbi:MAG: TIGR04086 family membrane protein [Clostridiales bacterium]|jgi:putative membrane protein (TIGR04086 family)|nr:TIGR04086 family membrane protein [Clostridiales bacterium]